MLKHFLFIAGLLFSLQVFAQTGIGTTTPDASAKLDVSATNKGFLPPRVTLTGITDNSTIPSPATGLLVYNTGNNNGLASGYYFWNGSAWATIATAGGSGSFAASFMRGSRTAAQTTNIVAGGVVAFSQIDASSSNDISLNTSTGQITLAAGRTYRLIAQVPNFQISSGDSRPQFGWYNETGSTYIGSSSSAYNAASTAGWGAFGGISEAIITTTTTTVVSYRMLQVINMSQIGGSGDFVSTGSYPWFEAQVISGNAPVTGQSVDYVSTSLSTPITSVGNNADIVLQQLNGGNIPYNSSTGIYTLSANKTYMMQAQLRLNSGSSGGAYLQYAWVDAISNSVLVSNSDALTTSSASGAGYGSKEVAQIIYTPTTNQAIKLRTTGNSGTQNIVLGNAIIIQLGSSAIVNPWVLSGNDVYNTTGSVGIGTSSPNSSAILDASSTSKGILIPRLTASQKNAIASPANGLLIFQTDAPSDFYYYNGSSWVSLREPNWTSAGTIQSVGWNATTTNPTIGATTVNDYSYKQIGSKTWKCQLTFSAGSSSTGANNGSGDYLFTLPNGLQFNTSIAGQSAYSADVGASSWIWPSLWLSSSSGSITNLSQGGLLYVVPYSSTQFRLIHVGIAGVGYVIPYASGYYGVGSNISWRVTFTFQSL